MATIIARGSNTTNFVVHSLDLNTDDIQIIDNLNINNDRLYYFNTSYYNNVRDVRITSVTFRQVCFGSDIYEIDDRQLETLMNTGHCEAGRGHSPVNCQVYAGKFFEPIAKEMGDKSLARCYAEIEAKREEHRKVRNIQNALLAIGSGTQIKPAECDINSLAADIETFLKNRKKCLAALKPKKRS